MTPLLNDYKIQRIRELYVWKNLVIKSYVKTIYSHSLQGFGACRTGLSRFLENILDEQAWLL